MVRKWQLKLLIVGFLLVLFISPGLAAPIISTFDTGDEGWRVGDLLASGNSIPTYSTGFIRTGDLYDKNGYIAPASFLGNKSAYFGGQLVFDLRVASTNALAYDEVVLSNGSLTLSHRGGIIPVVNQWTTFTVPLTWEAGWWKDASLYETHSQAATKAELMAVLSNLTALRIQADWHNGADQVDLDNVRMSNPVPLPGALVLLLL